MLNSDIQSETAAVKDEGRNNEPSKVNKIASAYVMDSFSAITTLRRSAGNDILSVD
jgi:hypothetical protein